MNPPPTPSRRGRLRAEDRSARQAEVIEAAFAELLERGAEAVTMLGIARRAGASKETLYSWYGSRLGLLQAMIEENADGAAARVAAALDDGGDPTEVLTRFAIGLLRLLTDDRSVALNRAAMTSPELADVLLASGRHRVGPIVERYLDQLHSDGVIVISDSADAFTSLYGLVIRDTQIRVLLGEKPPSATAIKARAVAAVEAFFALHSR